MTTGIAVAQVLRPAAPGDAAAVHRMFERCSAETRCGRFHGLLHALPEGYLAEALTADAALHDALVAECAEAGELVALGSARAVGDRAVEIGLLVEDAAQRRGVGTRLLLALAARARSRGVTDLHCDVLHRNRALLGTLRRTLGPTAIRSDGPVLHASVRLLDGRPPLPWRAP
jgi:GNAT superfamily N-acetyltransferase